MQRRFRLRRSLNAAEAGDAFWIQIGQQEPPPPEERSRLLCAGAITAYELVPWGSNYTFLVALAGDDDQPRAIGIYKPQQGEAPLWDFPDGTLYRREYAAYLLSRQLGWAMIPETVIREGPYGIGTVQTYIEVADDTHYFTLRESHTADLQQIAVFDIITNNADRKAGHLFQGVDGKVYGIDHGQYTAQTPHRDLGFRRRIGAGHLAARPRNPSPGVRRGGHAPRATRAVTRTRRN
jgi:hypothetical protein